MKKRYIKPEIQVYEMGRQSLLAGSNIMSVSIDGGDDNEPNVEYGGRTSSSNVWSID